MKFDVKFAQSSFNQKVDIMGPGAVYIDDTGIVVEGDFPRFHIPYLGRLLRRIICATGVRTIPYSRIVSYVQPSTWNGSYHRIVYLLPDQSKQTVKFSHQSKNAEIAARLQEHRAAAQSFSPT
jgi:hypothetical protein